MWPGGEVDRGLELGGVLERGKQIATRFPRRKQQDLPVTDVREKEKEEYMLSPRVGVWASGWMAMPHGRGRDLGQMQGFCSGVQSWCSHSTPLPP